MVYVDDMYDTKKYGNMGQFGRMKMSHMMADTKEELLTMADKIGVNRKWIQKEGTPSEHFDVSMSARKKAIEYGAKAITLREMGDYLMKRKKP